ncbi:type III secretion system HrpP C-terminal domain-containing protein [Vibrio sp. PP-XX7]
MPETNALECVLLLPRLGEVQLKASQSEQQWNLQLTFMRPAALDYVQKRQATLTQRLSERLGSPVILALSSREEKASREQQASHEENELED